MVSSVVLLVVGGWLERASRRSVIKPTVDDFFTKIPYMVVFTLLLVAVGLMLHAFGAMLLMSISVPFMFSVFWKHVLNRRCC